MAKCSSADRTTLRDLADRTAVRPEIGEVIRLWSGGGGGYGSPAQRDPAMVAADVAAGLVSRLRARDVYGVVLAGDDVDLAATASLRARMPANGKAIDFGAARTAWEEVHGEAAERLAAWLPTLPAGVRRYAEGKVYQVLHEGGPGPYRKAAISVAMAAVACSIGLRTDRV